MFQKPIFSREELAEFIIGHARQSFPAASFEPGEDDLTFRYEEDDGIARGTVQLHNVWEAYRRTGDLNQAIDFINGQMQASRYVRELADNPQSVNVFDVYPAVRPHSYTKELRNQGSRPLVDDAVPGLDTLFMERKDGFLVVLNQELIKPVLVYMDEGAIMRQAYDNLRGKGWVEPYMQAPALNSEQQGILHTYVSPGHPFHHQFFLRAMSAAHLPSTFLIAYPSQLMAVVLTVRDSIETAQQAKRIAERSGLASFVAMAFAGEPRPLSRNIYWVHGDRKYLLAGLDAN